jgi:tagatose 6-phosphate kinase
MITTSHRLLVVGPNPAWQKRLTFSDLLLGDVNRADSIDEYTGGKGSNFAHALVQHHGDIVDLVHFSGGNTGERLSQRLTEMGISEHRIKTASQTRTAYTVVNTLTGVVTPQESAEALEWISASIDHYSGIAFSGTCPAGVPDDFYFQIAEMSSPDQCVLLDCAHNLGVSLKSSAIDILKINSSELLAFRGGDDIASAARWCLDTYPVRTLVITAGIDGAYVFSDDEQMKYTVPKIKVVNPIGAGDTTSAVLLHQLCVGEMDLRESVRYALAAACASCLEERSSEYSLDITGDIAQQIQIDSL